MYTLVQILLLILGFTNNYVFAPAPNEQTVLDSMANTSKEVTNVRVLFKNNNIKNILQDLQSRRSANPSAFNSRDEKESEFYKTFKAHADDTQKKTIDALKDHLSKRDAKENKNKITFNQMWTLNQLFVWNADVDTIKTLAKMEDVSDIFEEEEIVTLPMRNPNPMSRQRANRNRPLPLPWNLRATDVLKAWANGFKGKGAVVGIIDTGVRGTHEALVGNWREDYGWFDPYDKTEKPISDHYHGTHVAGIAVGTNDTGVAPEAQWIACRGMKGVKGKDMHLDTCMEWMHCPTKPDGSNKDCSKRPHVVNNSWGSDAGKVEATTARESAAIHLWVVNNIVPVFSIGNDGPKCRTVTAPGVDERVIAVGASTAQNTVWAESGVGPAVINGTLRIKPDVVAPGYYIYSAGNDTDTDYFEESGTRFSTPHVAGLAALYVSRFPKGSGYADAFKKAIIKAVKPVYPPRPPIVCDRLSDSRLPNYRAGYGLVNAVELQKQLKIKGSGRSGSNSITFEAFGIVNQSFILFVASIPFLLRRK